MYESIKRSLESLGGFSEREQALFLGKLKILFLAKEDFLLHEGQVCQTVYFVNQGCFRQYHVTEKADEITLNLFVEDDWVLDYQSFTSQKPAQACIQATEEAEVLALSIRDVHALIAESSAFFRLGHILEKGLESSENRTAGHSPEMKYRHLLATKLQLVQKFPLKYIASLLGITPETLSRVRNKLSRSPIS